MCEKHTAGNFIFILLLEFQFFYRFFAMGVFIVPMRDSWSFQQNIMSTQCSPSISMSNVNTTYRKNEMSNTPSFNSNMYRCSLSYSY